MTSQAIATIFGRAQASDIFGCRPRVDVTNGSARSGRDGIVKNTPPVSDITEGR